MMSTPAAQTTVVTVGMGVLALITIDAARNGHRPEVRRLIGTGVATLGLSALANGAPQIAGPLALLWGTSALIVGGAPALAAVTKATTKPKPTRSTPRTAAHPPSYVV